MDINSIVQKTHEFQLKHPVTGKGLGIYLTLNPTTDKKVKQVEKSIQDKALHLRARGKVLSADQIEKNTIRVYCAALNGWRWAKDDDGKDAVWDGKKPDFNQENIEKFVSMEWVQKQIDEEWDESANFFEQ